MDGQIQIMLQFGGLPFLLQLDVNIYTNWKTFLDNITLENISLALLTMLFKESEKKKLPQLSLTMDQMSEKQEN